MWVIKNIGKQGTTTQLCNIISRNHQNPNHSDSAGYHDSVTTWILNMMTQPANRDSMIISTTTTLTDHTSNGTSSSRTRTHPAALTCKAMPVQLTENITEAARNHTARTCSTIPKTAQGATDQLTSKLIPARAHTSMLSPQSWYAQLLTLAKQIMPKQFSHPDHTANTDYTQPASKLVSLNDVASSPAQNNQLTHQNTEEKCAHNDTYAREMQNNDTGKREKKREKSTI
ncbi:thiamine pyrophosphokinase 2-like [Dorcoceras hygrometricum]|uniref:Thiamine pyrophosphokinase 2-like n=1 Tax=Dorcoceras hygrometricum TaxID=472368 RepID=A0A2Z7CQN2_9LAMI|nr:thiamine pyrophosphokinase 2-like [Dorcoceras hygrometricum]